MLKVVFSTKFLKRSFSKKPKITYYTPSKGNVSPILKVPEHIQKPDYVLTGIVPPMDKIYIKTKEEINIQREACQIARKTLEYASTLIKEGITTDLIDKLVHNYILSFNAYPSPLLYKGFPKSICTSINEIMVHGIPDDRKLKNSDIINIDITVYYKGYHGDISKTFIVGEADSKFNKLIEITEQALYDGIKVCGPNIPFNHIGMTIQNTCTKNGFISSEIFCGHGIGKNFHEFPMILMSENRNPIETVGAEFMTTGMVFTIEPVVKVGSDEAQVWDDNWTIEAVDGFISAQMEHTIAILEDGIEILTENPKKQTFFKLEDLKKK